MLLPVFQLRYPRRKEKHALLTGRLFGWLQWLPVLLVLVLLLRYSPPGTDAATPSLDSALLAADQAEGTIRVDVQATDAYVQTEWGRLIGYSILFYEAQRSGRLPMDKRVDWRHDSAVTDGSGDNLDLEGGYYDAGDYLKFTMPLAFSLTQLAWGGLAFWRCYVKSGTVTIFDAQLRWGLDWLIKAHPDNRTVIALVGDGTVDHAYWGPDTGIPLPRPAFRVNDTQTGTDLAATVCAAFASGAAIYRDRFNDTAYADLLYRHANETCALAEMRPFRMYQDTVPAVAPYYPSSGYYDDLCWAMTWMARITGDSSYLDRAKQYVQAGKLTGTRPPFNWDDKRGGCYIIAASLHSRTPEGNEDQDWRSWSEAYLDSMVNRLDTQLTPGGLIWFNELSDTDATVFASNTAHLLFTYAARGLPVNTPRRNQYEAFAVQQIDYILGRNPIRTPYVVGVHVNSPKNPHHAGAHGGNNVQNLEMPVKTQHILYGAVVGGPNMMDDYDDDRANWKQAEVALDYNAGFQSAIAHRYLYATDAPYYVGLPENGPRHQRSTTYVIVGVAIGAYLLVCSCLTTVYLRRFSLLAKLQSAPVTTITATTG